MAVQHSAMLRRNAEFKKKEEEEDKIRKESNE